MITIFTPTYNRAYTLSDLYYSIKNQICDDFEWIIVDDESNDNTEELVSTFDDVGHGIIYHKQKHGGKHRAINWGVEHARGDYFFIVDSDDCITKDAVQLIKKWVKTIETESKMCGVAGLRISKNGDIYGGAPTMNGKEYVDATNLEREKYNLLGDKAEVYATSVLRNNKFPEFKDEFFVTEATVWDSIAEKGYKIRWYNTPIYVCEYLNDGLTKTGANSRKGHVDNYYGFTYYVKIFLRTHEKDESIYQYWEYRVVSKIKRIAISNQIRNIDFTWGKFLRWEVKLFFLKIKTRFIKKLGGNA